MIKNCNQSHLFCVLILSYTSILNSNHNFIKKLTKNSFAPIKRSFLSIITPEITQYSEYKKIQDIIENNTYNNTDQRNFLLKLESAAQLLIEKIENDSHQLFYKSTYQKPTLITTLNFAINTQFNSLNLEDLAKLREIKLMYDTKSLQDFTNLDNNKSLPYLIIRDENTFRWHLKRVQLDKAGIIKSHELIKRQLNK